MPLLVKRKPKESVANLVKRFEAAVRKAGILLRAKEKLFKYPNISRDKKRENALYRLEKTKYYQKLKRWGKL